MNWNRQLLWVLLPLLALWPGACSSLDSGEASRLTDSYPMELGIQASGPDLVAWGDDLDEALTLASKHRRPVLALYRDAGAGGLTAQPLMAEAAEDLFIPLLLPAEAAGDGSACRILDAGGRDLVSPSTEMETPGELALLMVDGLEAGGGRVPVWFRLVAEENGAEERAMITLAMFCFWEGEAKLGDLDGVLATRSGMMGQDEVVEVVYDPGEIGFKRLVESAKEMECASAVYAHTTGDLDQARDLVGDLAKPAPARAEPVDDDQVKYALKRTPMARLPLTPMQATKINADIRLEANPRRWLSPRQLKLLNAVEGALKANPESLGGFMPPEKLSLLAEYQFRLMKRLGL